MGVAFSNFDVTDQFLFPAISIHAKYQSFFTRGKTSGTFALYSRDMKYFPQNQQWNTFDTPNSKVLRIKRREKLTEFVPYKSLPALKYLFESE